MNIQAMMKQAQKLQKDMMNAKEEIDNKKFIGKSSLVTVEVMGNKTVTNVTFDTSSIEMDDLELLQDIVKKNRSCNCDSNNEFCVLE